jgi:hypothetical protein
MFNGSYVTRFLVQHQYKDELCSIFIQRQNFPFHEANDEFNAPERLTAFGMCTFLVISHHK